METDTDVAAWAKANRACYEATALVEMKGHEKVQIGFALDLYAALPMDTPAGNERIDAAARIWQRLKAIVESIVPDESAVARVDFDPFRTAAFLRPSNDMAPEVGLRARLFHKDDYFAPVTDQDRAGLSTLERKLSALGLRQGHW